MDLPENMPASLKAEVEKNLKIGASLGSQIAENKSTDDDIRNSSAGKSPDGSPANGNTNDPVEVAADASKIGSPSQALPKISFRVEKTVESELFGFRLADNEIADSLETDRVVVGLVVTQGEIFNGSVKAIAPIYQQENQYIPGETLGDPADGTNEVVLIAPAGHIVSGMQVQSGVRIMSLHLSYCPVDQKGKLNLKQIQVSQIVGIAKGGPTASYDPGKPIVSAYGALKGDQLASIIMIAAERLIVE